jgi:hypothetical protein
MAEKVRPRKKHPKIPPKANVSKRDKLDEAIGDKQEKDYGWVIAGFDVSMSSLAGAAMCYDATMKKYRGPAFVMRRWSKEDHYFDRLKMAAQSPDLIFDLLTELKLGNMPLNKIFIAQEEPFPPHSKFIMKGNSQTLKQQAEISGAFLGGLLRFGYENIWQIHNTAWRGVIADGLGITTHHTKWKDPALCEVYNCHPDNTGKFRAKQWAMQVGETAASGGPYSQLTSEIPDYPDIIENNKLGKIPRPEGSKARAVQPDDRYDALAIMWAQFLDLGDPGETEIGG